MPQENEAAVSAFYDHEIDEQPRTGGRRRRPAADWGVGDDIFDRMPSRRFAQRSDHRNAEWRDAPEPSEPQAEWRDDEWAESRSPDPRRFAKRPLRERHVETWDDEAAAAWGGEAIPRGDAEDGRRTIVIETAADEEGEAPHVSIDGRRTIVISGHPDRLPAPRVQRPARTAVDRIGSRPDRIVGYTVALGVLLIVIAILTT